MKQEIQSHIKWVEKICSLIENEEDYNKELVNYLPMLNEMIQRILKDSQDKEIPFEINEQFVIQVLKDIVDGMERRDSVFLLDALYDGLMAIFEYVSECI